MMKKDFANNLNPLIDELNISSFSDYDKQLSENDIAVLHLQLQAAQIILNDAAILKQEQPNRNLNKIISELSETWKENIYDLALALSEKR